MEPVLKVEGSRLGLKGGYWFQGGRALRSVSWPFQFKAPARTSIPTLLLQIPSSGIFGPNPAKVKALYAMRERWGRVTESIMHFRLAGAGLSLGSGHGGRIRVLNLGVTQTKSGGEGSCKKRKVLHQAGRNRAYPALSWLLAALGRHPSWPLRKNKAIAGAEDLFRLNLQT